MVNIHKHQQDKTVVQFLDTWASLTLHVVLNLDEVLVNDMVHLHRDYVPVLETEVSKSNVSSLSGLAYEMGLKLDAGLVASASE